MRQRLVVTDFAVVETADPFVLARHGRRLGRQGYTPNALVVLDGKLVQTFIKTEWQDDETREDKNPEAEGTQITPKALWD